jgi:hypothetical protein
MVALHVLGEHIQQLYEQFIGSIFSCVGENERKLIASHARHHICLPDTHLHALRKLRRDAS